MQKFIHTNSPGNLLRGVKLYSVVSDEILTTRKTTTGFCLTDLSKNESLEVDNKENLLREHSLRQQEFVLWVDDQSKFLSFQLFDGDQLSPRREDCLTSRQDILVGMKKNSPGTISIFIPVHQS